MQQYVARPLVVEAVQFTGDNEDAVREFLGECAANVNSSTAIIVQGEVSRSAFSSVGDWIVKRGEGKFEVMADADFELLFSPIGEHEGHIVTFDKSESPTGTGNTANDAPTNDDALLATKLSTQEQQEEDESSK